MKQVAKAAKYAAINAIFQNITEAERRKFMEWQKKNVRSNRTVSAFGWPGLKPYLEALADEVKGQNDAAA